MSAVLLANVTAYSLQLGALVIALAIVHRLVRVLTDDASVTLALWQGAFVVACVVPAAGVALAGRSDVVPGFTLLSTASGEWALAARSRPMPWIDATAACLAAGAILRLAWLGMGWLRILRWCSAAEPLVPSGEEGSRQRLPNDLAPMDVRVSEAVKGPVSVGIVRPCTLVPPRFLALPPASRRAVLLHEQLHGRRRDPLRTLIVEMWCAVFWFHPAARLLADRLDLAREMYLDRETIRLTGDRPAYARALLAFGTSNGRPVPGSAFIRRAHLSERIHALTQEVATMPDRRRWITIGTLAVIVAGTSVSAAWLAPMPGRAAAGIRQAQRPYRAGEGVQMPRVLRKETPDYPREAMDAKVQGAVLVAVVVEPDGTPGRIEVRRSLDRVYGLDDAAVDAVSRWLFEPGRKDGEPVPVEVEIEMMFTLRE